MLNASEIEPLFRRVEDDKVKLNRLVDEVTSLAGEVVWAVDQRGGSFAMVEDRVPFCGELASVWREEAGGNPK